MAKPLDIGFIENALAERRTLERALADLAAKYKQDPSRELARMIRQLEAEIEARNRPS
jgi:hypothetical protein